LVEDSAILSSEEQHWRGPLAHEVGKHRFPSTGDRLVDGLAVRESAVKLAGEHDGRAIGDRELHRHDGGRFLLDQSLGHAAVGVDDIRRCGLARVEDDEAKRVVIAYVGAELRRRDSYCAPIGIAEGDEALARSLVEVAVSDEVQNMYLVPP
jgi:hypothetical protein